MCAQMHFPTFDNPISICIVINVDDVKEMLVYELSDDINHIKMHWEFAEIIVRKNKKSFFHKQILNMDISLNIPYRAMEF